MKEKTARRSSLTLLEVGVILVIAVSLGAYVVQRANVARQKAVAGTLKAAGAKIKFSQHNSDANWAQAALLLCALSPLRSDIDPNRPFAGHSAGSPQWNAASSMSRRFIQSA
ncbi:MAG: hypothetical protein O2820_15135 [Planctomycetota bacterium]|nr:hypothetical protein [Planctomycetota bacterium]MDA1250549.1 hypothetical protein [Planctomycetota bacterium]